MDLGLLTIKKNNALTDGNIPDRKVMANKLLNALYFKYEQEGDTFRIAINDLAELLGRNRNCGKTKQMISDGLKILQQPIEIRNFEYEGKGVKWHSSPFLQQATIYTEDKNYIDVKLSGMLIEALKQKEHYTVIDLEISNKFKTKYGLVIWEMYLRYKNQQRDKVPNEVTYQMFSLDELNKKFGTSFKYTSKMLEGIERGLKEIEVITKKKIVVKYQKNLKKFGFFWKKEKDLITFQTDKTSFIKHIRNQHINELLLEIDKYKTDGFEGKIALACSEKGRLYDMYQQIKLNAIQSEKLWTYLFKHQNKITALKQGKFEF
jgi:hypothetical protein